jgi:hypothetical protein
MAKSPTLVERVALIIDSEAFGEFAAKCERTEAVTFWPERREIALNKARSIATLLPSDKALEQCENALERIAAGSKLGKEMFEQRVRDRKGRLTWHAVNVLQDHLAACEGTASATLSNLRASK